MVSTRALSMKGEVETFDVLILSWRMNYEREMANSSVPETHEKQSRLSFVRVAVTYETEIIAGDARMFSSHLIEIIPGSSSRP